MDRVFDFVQAIQNAIQASPDREKVEIRSPSRQDGPYRLEVANRGAAIPDELVPSLFTPYFTTKPNGSGLGLAIVRHMANLHGWETGYTPRSGGGSIFWLDGIRD